MLRRIGPWLMALLVTACTVPGGQVLPTTTSTTTTPATTTAPTTTTTTSTTTPTTTTSVATTTSTTTPVATGPARVVRRGPSDRRAVALTFDAGSDAGFTIQILDILGAEGIVAGFGVTGRWVEQHPDLVRRIVAEGHQVINHSYSHPSFTGYSTGTPPLSTQERWAQLDGVEVAVVQVAGVSTKPYFRPPYGDYDESVLVDVNARGYRYLLMWTVDSLGWQGLTAEEITRRCLSRAEPGAVYLFHVGSASQDGNALPAIIEGLRADGYSFLSVAEVIGE